MSNPTSNFGWQMPTPTDLVTDLPADFEVFGQAVDTDFVDLLGGTTGQVLSKTSNTDLDFTWINNDTGDITGVTAGTGISGGGTSGTVTVTNSMATAFTTSGDLIQATGSGTFARLGTGTNGQYLTTNGTTNSWVTASTSAVTLISTVTLTTTASTISFTSISSSYTNLRLTYQGKVSSGYGNFFLRFNADTGANYDYQTMDGVGASASPSQTFATNYISVGLIGGVVGGGTIDIPNYKGSTLNKVAIGQGYMLYGTSSGQMIVLNHGGRWRNTSAITQLDFTCDAGDFQAGTVVSLYGES